MAGKLTDTQETALNYLRSLEKTRAQAWLMLIVKPTDDGAKISVPDLEKLYDHLGYDGRKEAGKITWDFADELAGMYKELWG